MDNAELCARVPDSDPAWIRKKLWIETRWIAAEDEQASDLATHAGKKAIEAMNKLEEQTRDSRKKLRVKYLEAKSNLSSEARDAKNAESEQRWRENATKIETLVKRYEEPERSTLKRLVGQITSAR